MYWGKIILKRLVYIWFWAFLNVPNYLHNMFDIWRWSWFSDSPVPLKTLNRILSTQFNSICEQKLHYYTSADFVVSNFCNTVCKDQQNIFLLIFMSIYSIKYGLQYYIPNTEWAMSFKLVASQTLFFVHRFWLKIQRSPGFQSNSISAEEA